MLSDGMSIEDIRNFGHVYKRYLDGTSLWLVFLPAWLASHGIYATLRPRLPPWEIHTSRKIRLVFDLIADYMTEYSSNKEQESR
jgi:hypothetical protein